MDAGREEDEDETEEVAAVEDKDGGPAAAAAVAAVVVAIAVVDDDDLGPRAELPRRLLWEPGLELGTAWLISLCCSMARPELLTCPECGCG